MPSLGIPYAPAEVTNEGLVRICPVCNERIVEPLSEFDEYGENVSEYPPYQMHFLVNHPDV